MKKAIFAFIIMPVILISCKKDNSGKPKVPDINLTPRQAQIINNNNVFGFDLFQRVCNSDQNNNIFISPLSVSIALGMTLNGSAGDTKTAMENTLRMNGMTTTEINETYKTVIDYLKSVDPLVIFKIANSIWYRNDFQVLPDFLNVNQTYFYASVTPLNFNDNSGSVKTINDWVASNTNNKINQIVDQINPYDIMFLINAIYFKGNWQNKFDKNNTSPKTFHHSDGSSKETPFMVQKGTFRYFSNDLLQAIELPYGNSRYNMYVLLPAESKKVEDVLSSLNETNWENWLNSLSSTNDVEIQLPKFKYDCDITLNDILTDMGMGVAFTDLADFTGINSSGGLLITKVRHKTYVEVNEEGTEAAAVTSVGVGATSVPEITYFIADRPFLFVIAEKETKSVAFIGKIADPVD